jgi:lysozyme
MKAILTRRWLIRAGIVCLIGFCSALIGWLFVVPEYRPSLREGERFGLDVSHHQGAIDWNLVRKDGIEFAYLKATEGGDYVDRMFARNATEATAAGLDIGAYHFFTFCRSGREQAENYLRVAPPQADWLPPVIDSEYAGNCLKRPTAEVLRTEVDAFVAAIEAAWDRKVTMYVLDNTESDYGIAKALGRPRWRRSLFRRPRDDDWIMWQISCRANVNGVSGPLNLNLARPRPLD